jgi:hypothetical protein
VFQFLQKNLIQALDSWFGSQTQEDVGSPS